MAGCVTIPAAGIAWALRRMRQTPRRAGFWPSTGLFVLVAMWVAAPHLLQMTVWAAGYVWNGALPDMASALYFSAVTYTTTGYGDIVLQQPWRIDGGIEALRGILMCGWSTGFFFAMVNRVYTSQSPVP